jgi:hypothetical protein
MSKKHLGLVITLIAMVTTGTAAAQEGTRAWQNRLEADIPLPVPMVELQPVNPFSRSLDETPKLHSHTPPRKLDIRGKAEIAVYVNESGDCPGAEVQHSPFPRLTSSLIEDCKSTRFEPAKVGKNPVPTWSVLEVTLSGRIKESSALNQELSVPDPISPPQPAQTAQVSASGSLTGLRTTDPGSLTSQINPRRLRIRIPSREQSVPMRALVHITAEGRCDQFVPLEVDSGLIPWLSAFLATWNLEPARSQGEAVDCWMIYTADIQIKFATLSSGSDGVRVLRDRTYNPG